MNLTIEEAKIILGTVPDGREYGIPEIKALYARRIKEAHPDTGRLATTPKWDAALRVAELQQARDLLLEALESQKCACKLCRGVGQVRSGMGWRSCSACDGTGETR